MRISYNNYIDTLTTTAFTVLTESVGYEKTNIQDQRLSMEYRTTAVTAQTIIFDLGSAKTISTAAIIKHNFTSAVSIIVEGNTTNSWPGATSKTIIYNSNMLLNFFTPISYQYWKITIDDPTNTFGYLSMGRVWLGDYITINPSSDINFTVNKKRSDRVIHGRGQQKFASIGNTWKEFKLSFSNTNYSVVDQISLMYDTIGNHTSVIYSNFDTTRNLNNLVEPTYCSIQNELTFKHNDNCKYNYELNLQEEL